MRRILLLLLAIATAPALAAVTVTTDPTNHSITPDMRVLPIHIVGRVQAKPLPPPLPAGAIAYRHEWPGIYFEAAFVGERVTLKFDDGWHEYRLLVDDDPPIALIEPGKAEVIVSGLARKKHRVRLEKVSESFGVPGTFAGFYVPADDKPLRVKARARQIEFIGPSGMTGFGTRSTKTTCTFEELRRTTDTQQAYPALVAKHYGADYQISANSGHGLIRNVKAIRSDPGLTALYPFTFFDRTVPYADPDWRPQIIEIAAWGDFSGDTEPGEKWNNVDALMADWVKAFGTFIAELHRRSPAAAILIDWPEDADINPAEFRAKFARARETIVTAAHAAGVKTILFPSPHELIGKLESTACDHHGSLKDQRTLADWLIAHIDADPGLWRGR